MKSNDEIFEESGEDNSSSVPLMTPTRKSMVAFSESQGEEFVEIA